jgi:SAM-dependent methyltransferase
VSASAPQDRWWHGLDSLILDGLPRGSRIVDVGCGSGVLVERIAEAGHDAVGVDPRAPARPRLVQRRVEDLGPLEPFDAACALMSLHHADLDSAVPSVARLLRPGGRMFVYELAWEAYDERAAAWLRARGTSDADHTVAGWMSEHSDLHTSSAVHAALAEAFELDVAEPRPYLARMLDALELEGEEQREIAAGRLPALGRLWIGSVRH